MEISDFSPPESFDEYRLIDRIGRGGIGQVFRAHDALLDRHVAIKFLAAIEPGTAARERFLVEARAAARLQHPNIVTVHRVGWLGTRAYLVSELVRGQSLDRLLRPVSSQRALELGVGLARGLAAAHRRGVLHRDIKPANAIVDDTGSVKLLDFGLAKLLEAEARPVVRAATPASAPVLGGDATISFANPELELAGPVTTGGITRVGAVMGTPYYMAPEAWRGDPPTRRTDVYALGALLYELCAGRPPHHGVPLAELPHVVGERDAPPLVEVAPDVDPAFGRVIDRCLAREPAERPASGEEVRDALEQLVPGAGGVVPEGNPYRGLAAFEAEHRALFFGRDTDVRAVVERLHADSFVLVAGDSGVGKSSLCRAGIVPRVREGALGGGRDFTSASVIPGRRPLAALAAAVAPLVGFPEGELHADLARGDAAQIARVLRARLGAGRGLLLFVDQLEELITLAPPDEAALFADAMAEIVLPSPSLRLLATVRGDFVTRVVRLGRVGPEVGRALYLLAPLGLDGAREAIVGPARRKGVRFDPPAVVEELAGAVATGDGGLPLLQFALAELWDARDVQERVIHRAALDAIGGAGGALGRHADGVLSRLLPAQREAARRVLCSLVTSEGTRARRFEEELGTGEDERAALEALVRGRLIVARPDTQGTSYEVAHESLLQQWSTLRAWLADDAGRRATRERLAAAAAEWERLDGAPDVLWRDRQLAEAAALDDDPLPARDRRFVVASRRAARRGRVLRIAAVMALPLVAAGVWGALRLQARTSLERRVGRELAQASALFQTAAGLDHQLSGLRAQAFARFDAHERTAGDEQWTTVLARAADVDRAYGRAAQAAETALLLDGSRHDVRALLANAVFQRALHAETEGRVREMDEYLARLALYDEDGSRRAAWDASARLTIGSDPAGATVSVERFDEREGQPSRWTPVGTPLVTPASLTLARGSYRLAVSAPGHASIHLPVLLGRGEELRVAPALPRAAQVPAGWLYVPRGRFLVGSASEESYRKGFLQNSPLHAIDGGGFLIRQHEVTYREWLAFLRTLAPAERKRRAPRTATVGLQGNLELSERPDGRWELRMQPSTQVYRAIEGERIRYAKRTHNAEQDWLDLPISGISYEDATAYATWSGARLCTDEEWEQAARGADGRMFPHGKHMRPGDVNDLDTYQHDAEAFGPDAVGLHPASKSPYGADDMAGNVWEWVSSKGESGGRNAVRGGAYPFDVNADRTEHRELAEVTLRDITIGARVCDDVAE